MMSLWLRGIIRIHFFVLIAICAVPNQVTGQITANVPVREVQVAADAFSLGVDIPAWVAPLQMPEAAQPDPLVLRLLDTQYLAGSAPVMFYRRALLINDTASLTSAGQIGIRFVPEYQHVKVHAIRILRSGESLDRTGTSSVRFLQRETGLERGIYNGETTASILV